MKILITGAAGMIGAKLAASISEAGHLGGEEVSELILADIVQPDLPGGASGTAKQLDLGDKSAIATLVEMRPQVIFHLAAVVSGEAEADLVKGYTVNLDGTSTLLHQISALPDYCPRLVFASSIAVFGAPLPDPIPDDYPRRPLTSYGTQKAMAEMLIDDLSRRGHLDGISLRLPTICVRPGRPNAAASGFFSSILREPLIGEEAILPVDPDLRHWFASPRSAVGFLRHAAGLDLSRLGQHRALSLPGVGATVAEQIAALERAAGPRATALIQAVPDPAIRQIVENWPRTFAPARAHSLGFLADADMDAILKVHIEDELGGSIPLLDG